MSPQPTRRKRNSKITPYDFAAPPRLARDQSRLFEVSLETFARQWTTQIASRLSCVASVTVTGVEQEPYADFVARLETPTMMFVLSIDDFGTSVFAMPVTCVLDHMEHGLGGPGGEQKLRQLTDIEVSVAQNICEKALAAAKYPFQAFLEEDIFVDLAKQDPQLLQAGRPTDMMVISEFSMELADLHYPIYMMMPLGPLQERLHKATNVESGISAEELRRAERAKKALSESVPAVPVDMCLRLAPKKVSPQDVLDLKVGDFVQFQHRRSKPLEVATSGQVIARGVPTTSGRYRACLIVNVEENNNE